MPRTVKLRYWENLVSVVSHRKRQYTSSETIEGRWILWTLTEPVARVSSKDADACVHTNLLTDMTRYADQYNRIQCLYRHPGRHQQHSHTCEHERPNLILFSPDWDGDSLVAHTQISSIHRHTHICTFLNINICSKTAKYPSPDPMLSLCISPRLSASSVRMWVSFDSLASPTSVGNHVPSKHREHKVRWHSKN